MMLGELKSGGVKIGGDKLLAMEGKEGSFCNREAKYGIILLLV